MNSSLRFRVAVLLLAAAIETISGAALAVQKQRNPGPAGGPEAAPVQMLVPGFHVRALPLRLHAINAVRYRPDGKLVALGYDGKVYLLSDTDGDGLEDHSEVFYAPDQQILSLCMALTPPEYPKGQGVFIARKGNLVLELDTDGDDRADKEVIVGTNWETPKRFPGGASDAIGVAVDSQGSIFFGLGAANSQNGYLLDNGVAGYRITSERGSIMRVSPDFSRREIIATGIRAAFGMAFNADGELFCTDQEGATWMPNGNPFDELLHIQPERHYGFPPRHPVYLPNVIDEPSLFDYSPQHESTCGLQFNEPVNGGPIFGPDWWRGDAFVAGESRGKIHRTKLVRSTAGYVAKDQIIARSSWLTIDQCVSPSGDLLLTTHSGNPDWGNGPNGIGRLFKISKDSELPPQPVLAYQASPSETHIAFDAPVSEAQIGLVQESIKLTEGWFVKEGDSFESFRPGYRVINMQLTSPRTAIDPLSVSLTSDRRTLIVRTHERHRALNLGIEFRHGFSPSRTSTDTLPQAPILAVASDFTGVEASWISLDGNRSWHGWIPHCDLQVAKGISQASATHAELWDLIETPGRLTLTCQLDLWSLLRPAIQPGERLDFSLPTEHATVRIVGPLGTKVRSMKRDPALITDECDGTTELRLAIDRRHDWLPIEISMPTGPQHELGISWYTREDERLRPFALRRVLVPWAKPVIEPFDIPPPAELAGGDWQKGEQIFKASCVVCHSKNGQGGRAGPDLSNLVYRDYASVYKDVVEPNATINPDFVAFVIVTESDQVHTGIVIEDQQDYLVVASASGSPIQIKKQEIVEMKSSNVSLMPTGLEKTLSPQALKDLLSYLMIREPTTKNK